MPAAAMACDAAMAPIVTGEVNPAVLEDLIRLCVQLDKLRYPDPGGPGEPGSDTGGTGSDPGSPGGDPGTGSGDARGGDPGTGGQGAPAPDTTRAWEALEQAVIGKAVDLLSGPGGLAGFLRRRQLGARLGRAEPAAGHRDERVDPGLDPQRGDLAGQALPVGRAVQSARQRRARSTTSRHKKNGGKTSTKDCVLLCFYHHQVVIHRWGWTLVLNPDGTTTAWNKDKTKVLHSHSPPAEAG